MLGSTAAISTNTRLPACAVVKIDIVAPSRIKKRQDMSGDYKRKWAGESIACHSIGGVGFGDPLQEKTRGLIRQVETQLKIRGLARNFRRLRKEQQIGGFETQPFLG